MTDLKQLLEKHGISPNKSLGQNFLHKTDIINSIADASAGTKHALEIGAGPAILTRALCDRFETVTTVEIDRSLKSVTEDMLRDVTNHTMVYADFLKFKLDTLDKDDITVVGNLPYNITGDIITKLLKNRSMFKKAVIMIQKEAAEKLTAPKSTPQYRAISVLSQYFCDIETVLDVTPDCFIPAPKVTSRVITLSFKKGLFEDKQKSADFFMFVHRIFNMRRKLLTAIFQTSDEKEKAKQILHFLGHTDKARGEELTPNEMAAIFTKLYCE